MNSSLIQSQYISHLFHIYFIFFILVDYLNVLHIPVPKAIL